MIFVVRVSGSATLLRGEAGMGKTALLGLCRGPTPVATTAYGAVRRIPVFRVMETLSCVEFGDVSAEFEAALTLG